MKKTRTTIFAVLLLIAVVLPSCATVFGGPVSACQRTKPAVGQPQRAIRGGALALDILLFWPGARLARCVKGDGGVPAQGGRHRCSDPSAWPGESA